MKTAFRQLFQNLAIGLHAESLLTFALDEERFSKPGGRKAGIAALPRTPYVTAKLKLVVLWIVVLELSVPFTVMV